MKGYLQIRIEEFRQTNYSTRGSTDRFHNDIILTGNIVLILPNLRC